MPKLVARVGVDRPQRCDGQLGAEALRDALDWARNAARLARAPLECFAWPRAVERTIGLYRRAIASDGRNRAAATPA